jgi:hypothetical protein
MSVFSSVFVGWTAFNALIFISLVFFRRDRPAARLPTANISIVRPELRLIVDL